MEGEEREASVIDESCVEDELGGSNVDELHAVESEEVTRVCLLVCKRTLLACSQGVFRHNLNNIDTTEPISLCQNMSFGLVLHHQLTFIYDIRQFRSRNY
jgi:hypothetical protein